MSLVRRTLTFSNLVAFAALFVALGGSVYAAAKLNGTQIQPNSIPGNRLKAKTVTAKQVKARTLTGTQVKSGSLTGTQIKEATLSGVAASSLGAGSLQYPSVTVPLGPGSPNGHTGTASCPAGTSVVGGGATLSNDEQGIVNDSGPASSTGWTATGYGASGVSMVVTAICASVSTG